MIILNGRVTAPDEPARDTGAKDNDVQTSAWITGDHVGHFRTNPPYDGVYGFTDPNTYPVVLALGCFDVIHGGHVTVLRRACEEASGGILCVGVNSDESVRQLKGKGRPVVPIADRLEVVHAIVGGNDEARWHRTFVFDYENTDHDRMCIESKICPTVIVKGGDYKAEDVPEAKGRRLILVPHTGQSTTDILSEIIGTCCGCTRS